MYAVISEPARDILNWGSRIQTSSTKVSSQLLPSRLLTLENGWKHIPYVQKHHASAAKDRFISLRCKGCSRERALFVMGPNRKLLKVSAFKSNGQNDESGGKPSKSFKKTVGLSYAPAESEAISTESPEVQSVVPTYPSDAKSASSLAIHNLFKSWLMLLHMPSARQTVDESLEETTSDTSGTKYLSRQNEKTRIVKAVWCYFVGLDATLKTPLLIFIPWYLAVNLMYGPEVGKELYPLWIFGPLIVAVYIKLLQSICALYVFSFKQSVKMLKQVHIFYQVAHNYTFSGQLKENLRAFLHPLVYIKNMDYIEASLRLLQKLNSWFAEKHMDFVESIWPYYCRTVRSLKRAHFI